MLGKKSLLTVSDVDYSQKGDLKALIDYCSFTVPYDLDFEHDVIGTILNLDMNDFIEQDSYFNGYSKVYKYGHIIACTDGIASKHSNAVNYDMGHHVSMSGQACRELEKIHGSSIWRMLIGYVIGFNGKFTRIDLAVDDFKGYFTIPQIEEYFSLGLTSTLFRTGLKIEKTRLKDGLKIGNSYYLGSPESDAQMYFYEKSWEQIKDNHKEWVNNLPFWNRTEIRLRKQKAQDVATTIYNEENKTLGYIIGMVFNKYLRFLEPDSNNRNYTRWKTADFWIRYIGHMEKIELSSKKPDRNIDTIEHYIEHQTSRNLLVLNLAKPDRFEEIIIAALDKLSDEDIEIIAKQNDINDLIRKNKEIRKDEIIKRLLGEKRYYEYKNKKILTSNK